MITILEKSTHQKLSNETLNLIKRVLEVLSKKDQDVQLYNQILPIVIKILTSLDTKASYD